METLTAGMPARLDYELFDYDGAAMDDGDVTTLSYSVQDVTNGTEVRASTALSAAASGSLFLTSQDTQINGTGSREKRRVCFLLNTDELWCGEEFYVASRPCEPSA